MLQRLLAWIGLARIVAFALIGFAIFVRVLDPIPVQIVRNQTFDLFQRLHPREVPRLPVTIIDVDDTSIAEIGQWPWPRTRFADLVTKITADDAVAIAFDILFAEPDRLSPKRIAEDNANLDVMILSALSELPDNDDILAQSFLNARVVLGQTSVRSALAQPGNASTPPEVPHALIGMEPDPFIMKLPDLIQNLPQLEANAAGRGVFSARPEPDGVYRRVPLVVMAGGELRLGLAPELLRVATGGQAFAVRTNAAGIDGVILGGQLIQTAGDGTVRPYLSPSSPARYVSAADLLTDRMPAGRLTGHLVFVGTSAIGLEDYRATPLGTQMAGVEIHAQVLENLLSNTLLKRPNYAIAVELVAAFMICVLLVILTPVMNATILIVSTFLFLATCGFVSFGQFRNDQILLDPSFPILAGLATIVFMATTNYLREEQRRRAIRHAFQHYVSEDLVNALTEKQEPLKLGGETRDLTVMFSDVRGFTKIAESFRDNPADLTDLMNKLLNRLSHAILQENGTIDKFIGDAVMAFWNAPLDHAEHAHAACRAALQMRDSVRELNELRRQRANGREYHVMHIGIGISTGSCMVGNMGSDARFDYTAMGDPVNLASRLESQSRYYSKTILVSSATRAIVEAEFALLELDTVRLKGKTQPETIYALLGDATLRADPRFTEVAMCNTEMLEAYRSADWTVAQSRLVRLEGIGMALDPALETYFSIYRKRIEAHSKSPVPADWDGIYDAAPT